MPPFRATRRFPDPIIRHLDPPASQENAIFQNTFLYFLHLPDKPYKHIVRQAPPLTITTGCKGARPMILSSVYRGSRETLLRIYSILFFLSSGHSGSARNADQVFIFLAWRNCVSSLALYFLICLLNSSVASFTASLMSSDNASARKSSLGNARLISARYTRPRR